MNFRPALLVVTLLITTNCYADDLDDGIGIDGPIDDDLNLSKNVKFIIRKALAQAKTDDESGGGTESSSCGSGNIVIGAGSNVKEVINISTNTGTTAVCGQ